MYFRNKILSNNVKNKNIFSLITCLNVKYIKKVKLFINSILELSFYSHIGSVNIAVSGKDNQFLNKFIKYFYYSIKNVFSTNKSRTISISYNKIIDYEKFLLIGMFMTLSISKIASTTMKQFVIQMFSNSFAYVFRTFNNKNGQQLTYFVNILKYYWKQLKEPIKKKLLFIEWKNSNNTLLSNKIPVYFLDIMLRNIKVKKKV